MKEAEGNLRQYLGDMIAVERHVEEVFSQGPQQIKGYGEVAAALRRFQAMAKGHREALEARLRSLGVPADRSSRKEGQTASAALRPLYAAFSQAVLGYAALHATAHRFYDMSGEDNTADLAEKHLQDYAQAVHAINQMVSDVAVWELGGSGQECQCQCPACGLGICVCAPHGTQTVNKAWRDAVSTDPQGNVWVRLPRRDSAAARARLRAGDVILAVDGQEVRTVLDLQGAIRKHQPGERIQVTVQRPSGEPQDVTLIR